MRHLRRSPEPRAARRGGRAGTRGDGADLSHDGRARRPLRLRGLRHDPAARAAGGRRAARPLPRDGGRPLPRRGGGPPRDLAPAAAPRREGRAARPAARGRLRPRAAARRGAPPRLDGDRAGAGARGARPRRVARPRRPRRPAGGPRPGHRRRLRGDRDGRRDRAPRGPGRRAAGGRGAARPRRRAVRRHARPRLAGPRGSPARAGGATCPRTPTCCRAARSSGCCARPGSTRSSTSACGGRSPSATGRAASASARAGSAARSRACAPPGSGGRR